MCIWEKDLKNRYPHGHKNEWRTGSVPKTSLMIQSRAKRSAHDALGAKQAR